MKKTHSRRKKIILEIFAVLIVCAFLFSSIATSLEHSKTDIVSKPKYKDQVNVLSKYNGTSDMDYSRSTASFPTNLEKNKPSLVNIKKTGFQVNPFLKYFIEPAPMGIADYGLGPDNTPYEYNTTSFLGIASIDSIETDSSSLNSSYFGAAHEMSFQLNLNLVFNNSNSEYVYWVQDVADLNTSSHEIVFVDNIWNFSSPSAEMHFSTVLGNGTIANSSGTHFYYDWASSSLPGNYVVLQYPTNIEFKIVSTTSNNQPEVIFMYNDGYGWVTYDNVLFKFVNDLTADYGFVVDGSSYNPSGHFYDAELILGGPGGGSQTSDVSSNLQLQLEYWNGHNFQQVVNAYNFGSDTAEGIDNVSTALAYYPENGSISEYLNNNPGELGVLYNSGEIAVLQVNSQLNSGTLYVNNTPYNFVNGQVNITLMPNYDGYYILYLYNSQNQLVWQKRVSLAPGEFLNLSTSQTTYFVAFNETGLPLGTTWYVNITASNGTVYNSGAITNTIYSIGLTNGTYTYITSTSDNTFKPSLPSSSFSVSGSSFEIPIQFTPQTYLVTFIESGLPVGTIWYVNISFSYYYSSNDIYLNLTNGTYTFSIGSSNTYYHPNIIQTTITVNGKNQTIFISFEEQTYILQFIELNLPNGTLWHLFFLGHEYNITNSSSPYFNVTNGTYSFLATALYYEDNSYPFTVNGNGVLVEFSFIRPIYTINLTETGLLKGTNWDISVNGNIYKTTKNYYSFSEYNGTVLNIIIYEVANKYYPSPQYINFTVNKNVSFTVIYTNYIRVTFTESGLPSGSTWYVNLTNGQTFSSTNDTVSFSEPNGTYSYTIATTDKTYEPSLPSGSLTVNGTSISKSVAFTEVKYTVTFTESGLQSGTIWYVNLSNGLSSGAISGSSYTFSLTNGTYSYTVGSVSGYSVSTSSGSITVSGKSFNQAVTFAPTTTSVGKYTVTFTETGLPSGTEWYVNITASNGTTYDSGPITNSSYSFQLSNGTYSYTIGSISGYNTTQRSGSISVSGRNTSQSATFSKVSTTPPPKKSTSPTTPNTDLYIIIGIVVAVVVIGAVVAIMMRRKK